MTATDPPPTDPPPHTPLPRALVALVGFMALVEIALQAADAGFWADPSLRARVYAVGAFWAPLVHGVPPLFAAQPATMFLTHALLHGGFLHMAMNMAVLLAMGRFVSDRYGPGAILPIFFVGAVAGGAVFGLIARDAVPMVGASGAIFAFLGVWIVWDWRRHRAHGVSVQPVAVRVAVLAAINLVFFFGLGGMLAWQAHLGGFLAGLLCGHWLEERHARLARAAARSRRAADAPPDPADR